MGLRSVFQEAAESIFDAFGDVAESATYTRVTGNPVYSPSTGTMSTPETSYTISVINTRFKSNEVDGIHVLNTDHKVLIPANDIAFTPGLHDHLTIDGVRENVVNKRIDPAEALWILQVRKP